MVRTMLNCHPEPAVPPETRFLITAWNTATPSATSCAPKPPQGRAVDRARRRSRLVRLGATREELIEFGYEAIADGTAAPADLEQRFGTRGRQRVLMRMKRRALEAKRRPNLPALSSGQARLLATGRSPDGGRS
jgi:hypothetical protein